MCHEDPTNRGVQFVTIIVILTNRRIRVRYSFSWCQQTSWKNGFTSHISLIMLYVELLCFDFNQQLISKPNNLIRSFLIRLLLRLLSYLFKLLFEVFRSDQLTFYVSTGSYNFYMDKQFYIQRWPSLFMFGFGKIKIKILSWHIYYIHVAA
jgi:hypothetical protein